MLDHRVPVLPGGADGIGIGKRLGEPLGERVTGTARRRNGTAGPAGAEADLRDTIATRPGQTVALTLNRFDASGTLWMLPRMQTSKRPIRTLPGHAFSFLMGTGGGAGFSTRPNLAVWTLLTAWRDGAAALAALDAAPFAARREKARETMTLFLAPTSSRGAWGGHGFEPGDEIAEGPVAAITRASVKARALVPFWRRVPAISDALLAGSEARLALGMGEVPYLHQVTFSVWDDVATMRRFASGPAHGEAARRVYRHGWFSEELFARFRVLAAVGTWNGRDAAELVGLQ